MEEAEAFRQISWKRTRKRPTLSGAGSGSKKYSTASASLSCSQVIARKTGKYPHKQGWKWG